MAQTEPAKEGPNIFEKVEATLKTWVEDPRVLLDTAVTVVTALATYHLTNDIATSTLVGIGVGSFIPPLARDIDNTNAERATPGGHYYNKANDYSFITRLAFAFKSGKADLESSEMVEAEPKHRPD